MEWFTLFDTYILTFAAGAMIYVVVEELIPEAKKENTPTYQQQVCNWICTYDGIRYCIELS